MTQTVSVYLNEGHYHFDGFDPRTAELSKAIDFDTVISDSLPYDQAITRTLELVFHQLNVDDPDREWAQLYRRNRHRSLSVGDVVTLGETAWSVASVGWEPVSTSDLTGAITRAGS